MKNKREQQIEILSRAIIESIEGSEFRWDKFFKIWYREQGLPLFFLFKKNLSVTNTQYIELFSLLTQNFRKNYDNPLEDKLLFYSTEHIKHTFTEVVESLIEKYRKGEEQLIYDFSELYLDIFSTTIAVDMFFCSCSVFLPPGIEVDLNKIVYKSGYLHSAGYAVYIRNIKKAKKREFIDSIDSFLRTRKHEYAIPFIVYSHEDFSINDKDSEDLIDKGIEQCKVYVDKMSMGSFRLSQIISDLSTELNNSSKVFIPPAGNFKTTHNFKKKSTLWLINDRSISTGSIKNPGALRYYICYEQVVKNESPFYFFDENKPAWKSHTTLPHSLTSALLNIANIDNNKNVCDPFGGTGTTWLELKKIGKKLNIKSSDISPITKLLHKDNARFFAFSLQELQSLENDLKGFTKKKIEEVNQIQTRIKFKEPEYEYEAYEFASNLLKEIKITQIEEEHEFNLNKEVVTTLESKPYLYRIVFYLCLKAELRFQSSFKRKSMKFENAFIKSLDKFLDQLKLLLEYRAKLESQINQDNISKVTEYIISPSKYSNCVTPSILFNSRNILLEDIDKEVYESTDALNLTPNSYDIVVCDPPYGFNTDENVHSLALLYDKFLEKAIKSLKKNGQLIICLPAESYTGKDLPFCTRSDIVSRQINIKAKQLNRLIYKPAISLPNSTLSPPYYWESDKALRRVILHFYIM